MIASISYEFILVDCICFTNVSLWPLVIFAVSSLIIEMLVASISLPCNVEVGAPLKVSSSLLVLVLIKMYPQVE